MAWQNVVTTLACGCEYPGVWDQDYPGDEVACGTRGHRTQVIERISRGREVTGSRNFQLGVVEGGEGVSDGSIGSAEDGPPAS
jgi:hypothetical protein